QLAARLQALHDNRRHARAGAVDRRGIARWAGADDQHLGGVGGHLLSKSCPYPGQAGVAAHPFNRARACPVDSLTSAPCSHAASAQNWRVRSAAFSPIMIVAALVLPPTMRGMTDASATRSPPSPRTRSCASHTASGPVPIAHEPT